jgi:hypothetical protein
VTIKYNIVNLPPGSIEANLVLGYYDATGSQWTDLSNLSLDVANKTVSGEMAHFTRVSVLVDTALPAASASPTSPAAKTTTTGPKGIALKVASLTIIPLEASSGENVNITATVDNAGGGNGSGNVTLLIDRELVAVKDINVDAGKSEKVTFTVNRDKSGHYLVDVNGQVSFFNVKSFGPSSFLDSISGILSLPLYVWIIIGAVIIITIIVIGYWWWRQNSYY